MIKLVSQYDLKFILEEGILSKYFSGQHAPIRNGEEFHDLYSYAMQIEPQFDNDGYEVAGYIEDHYVANVAENTGSYVQISGFHEEMMIKIIDRTIMAYYPTFFRLVVRYAQEKQSD